MQTTSKTELIKWINETFKLTISQMEQLASGQVFCQIFDYIQPNSIPSCKVSWKSTQEADYVKNYKLLADAFHKAAITKQIDIQALAKNRYLDILDLTQFLKSLFDKMSEKRESYDPIEYRKLQNERKILTNFVRKTLKDKTNQLQDNTSTSHGVKRPLSQSMEWRKKLIKKTPSLVQINEIMNEECDEMSKVNKIRSLFN